MLTKKTPEFIPAVLTIKAQGVENTLRLTYLNHPADVFDAYQKNTENFKITDGKSEIENISAINANFVLFLTKSFDDGTDESFPLTFDGLVSLERHWPGTLIGIIRGYHQARAAKVEKN